jgi:hypothetical protein
MTFAPRFPIYVPTKGRWESPHTVRTLQELGLDFRAVVEPQEQESYAAVIDSAKILVLPHSNKGLVVTRNWIWDHALESGAERFWTFDDNIDGFYRLNRNLKVRVQTGAILRAIEDFTDRFTNVPISGMNYFMFCKRKDKLPPFYKNTRVYSNMLIQTDVRDRNGKPFRNEGFYNDDTDLCLRVLKAGYCTILFNAFLINKATTMSVQGGMTPHYQDDGRLKMAQELAAKHPDVARVSWKFGRWQHHVDYSLFQKNELILKQGVTIPSGTNEYGMHLQVDGENA